MHAEAASGITGVAFSSTTLDGALLERIAVLAEVRLPLDIPPCTEHVRMD